MKILRRKARVVKIGTVVIGGNYPVAIQSMAKAKTSDASRVIAQLQALQKAGCEICRLAIKDMADARALRRIKRGSGMPLVADIHFDWRLAVAALENGADKIRLNPGNIYKRNELANVVAALKAYGRPLRVGVNSGSLRGRKLSASCLSYLRRLEKMKFYDIVVSLKGSAVLDTLEAYQEVARRCDYPMHLGVTATGLPYQGMVKTSIALGSLLLQGIGDTLRVSLTDSAEQEVYAAQAILQALQLRSFGPEIISCPTCGRCEVDLLGIIKDLERRLSAIRYPLSARPPKVAVMGCVVNGPGEAKEADIGIAFGKRRGLLFQNGRPLKKVAARDCVKVLCRQIRRKKDD
jgi:(E)-4-hydroxy-3-methylbut-2-enyl-diphosphate synthase